MANKELYLNNGVIRIPLIVLRLSLETKYCLNCVVVFGLHLKLNRLVGNSLCCLHGLCSTGIVEFAIPDMQINLHCASLGRHPVQACLHSDRVFVFAGIPERRLWEALTDVHETS